MKSIRKKLAVLGACAFMTMAGLGIVSANVTQVKSFKYDNNIYLGAMNYKDYRYVSTPNDAREYSRSTTRIGGDWNYDRYQIVIYYRSSQGYY